MAMLIRVPLQSQTFPHASLVKAPKGPVLHIPNVEKSDAGTYTCTASNGVGSMSADQIELLVLCKSCLCLVKHQETHVFFLPRPT